MKIFHLYNLSPCGGKQAGLTYLSKRIPLPPLFRICSNATSFLPSPPGEDRGRNFSCFKMTFTCGGSFYRIFIEYIIAVTG